MTLVLDRYEVVRRLAVGGMGEVFLAVQRGAGDVARSVILKAMLPELAQDPASVQAFLDEARVIATLNHPNVVSLYEVGVWQGLPLIAMEFVRGRPLSGLLRRCRDQQVVIPPGVALTIVRDVARGLHHAHQAKDAAGNSQQLIHRDVSPQNIMVRLDGVAKVLDFGIAHTALKAGRTATGLVKGKLAYMAPEQARGERLDQRADQFALGIVLWELLTQRRLYTGDNELHLIQKVQEAQVPQASTLGAPPAADTLLGRMLHPRPDQRFGDCGQVANALDELIGQLGGGTEAVASFMATLGEDDLDAVGVPSLGASVSPLPALATPRTDAPTATVPGRVARPALPRDSGRPSALVGGVVVLVLGALASGGWWWNQRSRGVLEKETRLRMALEQNARLAEKSVEGFCADSARLSALFPRVEGPWQRSAASFFESHIGWEQCPTCEGTWVSKTGSLEPPQRLVDKAMTPDDASVPYWRTVYTREDLAPLDFGWLDELQQFDHWWLSEHPRMQQWRGPGLEQPSPMLLWFQSWAKFRFARALFDNDLPVATAQIARVRALLRTQGTLLSDMISLSLQGIERGAIEEARLRGLNTTGLTPLSLDQSKEIRSVAFAGRTYAWPGVSPEVTERAFACSLTPCSMLAEAAWLHAMAGRLAPTDTRATFVQVVQRSGCDRELTLGSLQRPGDLTTLDLTQTVDPLLRVYDKLGASAAAW